MAKKKQAKKKQAKSQPVEGGMTIREILQGGVDAYKQYAPQFKATFGGRNLSTYWNHMTGFDLIKFDDVVVQPQAKEDESTKETVERVWGAEAVALVLRLIDAPGEKYADSDHQEQPA